MNIFMTIFSLVCFIINIREANIYFVKKNNVAGCFWTMAAMCWFVTFIIWCRQLM